MSATVKRKRHIDGAHVVKAVEYAREFLLAYAEDGGLSDDTEIYLRWWRQRNLRTLSPTDFHGQFILPLEWNETFAQELAARAGQGDGEAIWGLRSAAATLLGQGVPLPASLAAWVADYLMKGGPAKSSRRGPHPRANVQRDMGLARAVKQLTKEPWGFAATRNRGSRAAESACSIVCAVLAGMRINVDEHAIEKIWARYRDRI
jgi:hypothetical protein